MHSIIKKRGPERDANPRFKCIFASSRKSTQPNTRKKQPPAYRDIHQQLNDEQSKSQKRQSREGNLEKVSYRQIVTFSLAVIDRAVMVLLVVVVVVARQVDVLLVDRRHEVVVHIGRRTVNRRPVARVAVARRRRQHVALFDAVT